MEAGAHAGLGRCTGQAARLVKTKNGRLRY